MVIHGGKTGAFIWFVLWGRNEIGFNMSLYKTAAGLRGWAISEEWKDVPMVRMGKIEFTQTGSFEKIYWLTREDFLSQYEHL